ncbi:MAG: TolC family protein [Verrucomicrobiota bacterium]
MSTSILISGCQSFEPEPLDASKHISEWEARSADTEAVRNFVNRLQKTQHGPVQFDLTDGLDLEEGELISLIYNTSLRLERLKAGIAEASSENAGLWEDPEFNINLLRITESIPNPWTLSSALSFTVPISGRLEIEKKRADAEHTAALIHVAESEWNVSLQLRNAWVKWSALQLEMEESERTARVLESIVESQTALLESGEIREIEAGLFSIESTSHRMEIARLQGELEQGEQRIKALLGLQPKASVNLVPRINLDKSEVTGTFAEDNLTLERLATEYSIAELRLKEEIRKQYPDLKIGPQYESDEGDSSWGAISAIGLPLLNRNKADIAEAEAKRDVARSAYEAELEHLSGQLFNLLARRNALLEQQQILKEQLVPKVDRQLARSKQLLEIGEGSVTLLMDGVIRSHQAKLRLIQLQAEESELNNEIRHLQGPTDRFREF